VIRKTQKVVMAATALSVFFVCRLDRPQSRDHDSLFLVGLRDVTADRLCPCESPLDH